MMIQMDPISVYALLSSVDWKKLVQNLAADAANKGLKGLLGRVKPDESEKAARRALEYFVQEFLGELEDKVPLRSAIPGYSDQLKRLVEQAAPEIADWLQPETRDVDLGPVARMWTGLKLDPLPEDFDWSLVSKNYARDIRKYVKSDSALRNMLNTALLEQQTELQEKSIGLLGRIAGLDPGFDLRGYRDYLTKKFETLQLSAMHTSTYYRRVQLWNIFVPQSARESAPVRDYPRELLRRLQREGHMQGEPDGDGMERRRGKFLSSPVGPILDILSRDRLVVVLGDPGSGKTSLLKFLVMRWVSLDPESAEDERTTHKPRLPIWIDLKEYARERHGLLKYCQTGCATYCLDSIEVANLANLGAAIFYLDGLDEIFEISTRGAVVEEIAALASRYPQCSVVVTSRIVGYESDRLQNAGFEHATLEDFNDGQISEFLTKWYDAAEEDSTNRTRLLRQLQTALNDSAAVRGLAGNPLLLTMMAILNRNQALPRDRVELYKEASRVLLHEWDASRALPMDGFGRHEKEELLRELAGEMQQREGGLAGNMIEHSRLLDIFRSYLTKLGVHDVYEKATSLVTQLNERNFILCFAGADRYAFVHRTFLEYFCAAWFVNAFEKTQTLTLEALKTDVFGAHWKDEAWHEVLRLITGMVEPKKAGELLEFLMAQDGREEKFANLMLASSGLNEVRNRQLIQPTDDRLRRYFLENVVRYERPYYYKPYVDNDEVGTMREKGVNRIAAIWPSESTRIWLIAAASEDVDCIVRMAATQELAQGWKEHPDTMSVVKERALSDQSLDVRAGAIRELARVWTDNLGTLPIVKELVQADEDSTVRLIAMLELIRGWKGDAETLLIIKKRASTDGDTTVRMVAMQKLAAFWEHDPEVIEILKERQRFWQSNPTLA